MVDFMATGTTIIADRYYETLTKLRRAIQNWRRGMLSKGISILHDNARSLAARKLSLFCNGLDGKSSHPPYIPDLAPSDFHLFPKMKEHLSGMPFNDDDKVADAAQRFLDSMAVNWYDMDVRKLSIRLQKCFDRSGDYVQK